MFINLFDSHTHSDNSNDGHHSVMFMCEKAVEKDISGICVTDHCELRLWEKDRYELRIRQSVFEAAKARRVFNGKLAVMAGIELGDALYDAALTDKVLSSFKFDMVMASQHNTAQGEDIYYCDFGEWSGRDIDCYLEWYFRYLLDVARLDKFDVLAHLTYPVRYITGEHKIPVSLSRYDDIIDAILKTTAHNGRAIEINTSGLWQSLGDTMPSLKYVKRYRELGGEYITLGSDAHAADRLGEGIAAGMQMLLDAGFTTFSFYKERQPLPFKII